MPTSTVEGAEIALPHVQRAAVEDSDLEDPRSAIAVRAEVSVQDGEVVHPLVENAARTMCGEEGEQRVGRKGARLTAQIEGQAVALVREKEVGSEFADRVSEQAGLLDDGTRLVVDDRPQLAARLLVELVACRDDVQRPFRVPGREGVQQR